MRSTRSGNKIIIALLFTLWCAQVGAIEPLKIGYTVWVGSGPLFLAQEKKLYQKHGVQVELVKIDDTKLRYAAVAAKRLDGLVTVLETLPLYIKPHFRITAVLPMDYSAGADGIVAMKSIKTIADLRGKKVAFEAGSYAEFYVTYVLREAGLKMADIRGVNMKGSDAGAAMLAGRVDAAMTWEPWLSKAKQAPHAHLLHDSSRVPDIGVGLLAFRADVIENRREEIRGVVKAWLEALEYYQHHRDESLEIMAKKVGGWLEKPEDYAATLSRVSFYDEPALRRFFVGPDAPIYAKAKFALELWSSKGKTDSTLKPTDLYDTSLVYQ
jgi:NitT/TauT family transport system substrate-binding protein